VQTVDRIAGSSLSERTMLALVAAFAVLELRWNFYLFAIPGVVGAIAAALMPTIRPPAPIAGRRASST
jgi:hypothetical protein